MNDNFMKGIKENWEKESGNSNECVECCNNPVIVEINSSTFQCKNCFSVFIKDFAGYMHLHKKKFNNMLV